MSWVVKMPRIGQTMERGVVKQWLKNEGELVEEGEIIAIIESEKFTEEIEARQSGVLRKIIVGEGEEVQPGVAIGIVAETEEELPQIEKPEEEKTELKIETTQEKDFRQVEKTKKRIKASPAAKKLAREKSIDLTKVQGTGPKNSITTKDIKSYLAEEKLESDIRTVQEVLELSAMRKTIGERLGKSYRQAPHVTLNKWIEISKLSSLLEQVKEEFKEELSITDFLIKALVNTLGRHRKFNAIFEEEKIKLIKEVNLGIAIAIDDGLITPVLFKANEKDIFEISKERKKIVEKTLGGNYTMDDLSGGTFTISNLGPFGIDFFDPIINPPEVAILGINRIRQMPVENKGKLNFFPFIGCSLSFDHRILDGASAADFLSTFEQNLQKPLSLLRNISKGEGSNSE